MAARAIASTSVALASQTSRLLPAERVIHITPFGIDMGQFHPLPREPRSDGVIRVGTVKTLDPKYGIDVLLRAFALLRSRAPRQLSDRLRLEIVGGGFLRQQLEGLATALGIGQSTSFVGAVPHTEVPSRLARFDVYVALSRIDSESFGVAILEASACELPVVVSDVGGLPEVVEDGVTGLVVPREDPEAAACALARLVTDPALREKMGRAGRERVLRLYTWEGSLDAMERAMHATVGENRASQ